MHDHQKWLFLTLNAQANQVKVIVHFFFSNVILPFKWMMSKPCMKQSRNHIDTIDEFSAFKITPSSGEFPPDSCFDFQVYSSPKQVIRNRLVLFEFSYLKETLLHKRNNACWIIRHKARLTRVPCMIRKISCRRPFDVIIRVTKVTKHYRSCV